MQSNSTIQYDNLSRKAGAASREKGAAPCHNLSISNQQRRTELPRTKVLQDGVVKHSKNTTFFKST